MQWAGEKNHSYSIKPITILLRWTKNANTAETKIIEINDCLKNNHFFQYLNKNNWINIIYENPIDLGTDDKNIYEYSIELDIYYER